MTTTQTLQFRVKYGFISLEPLVFVEELSVKAINSRPFHTYFLKDTGLQEKMEYDAK